MSRVGARSMSQGLRVLVLVPPSRCEQLLVRSLSAFWKIPNRHKLQKFFYRKSQYGGSRFAHRGPRDVRDRRWSLAVGGSEQRALDVPPLVRAWRPRDPL